MSRVGKYNDRELIYVVYNDEIVADIFSMESYMLLINGKNISARTVETICKKSFTHLPLFIHCCGEDSSATEDLFHQEIIAHAMSVELSTGKEFDYEELPQTAFDKTLESALWFSCIAAFHEKHEIKTILILDLEGKPGTEEEIKGIVTAFNSGKPPKS